MDSHKSLNTHIPVCIITLYFSDIHSKIYRNIDTDRFKKNANIPNSKRFPDNLYTQKATRFYEITYKQ